MEAFFRDESIKESSVARVRELADDGKLVKGRYWENGTGCAVGATVRDRHHDRYESELGIPREVAYWEDVLFEALPNDAATPFPVRMLSAIPVGADLSAIDASMMRYQFEDSRHGLSRNALVRLDRDLYGFCKEVVELYRRMESGEAVPDKTFKELHGRIDAAWAVAGERERVRRMRIARRFWWLGARRWAWIGKRAWGGAWAWALAATRGGGRRRIATCVSAWSSARMWTPAEAGDHARIRAISERFLLSLAKA